jgi:putative acetyltransferase
MPSEFVIRPATVEEAEAIQVVHVAAILEHGPEAYTDRQVAAWAAKAEGTDRYTDAVADPSTEIVVAVSNDEVVGFGELDVDAGEVEAVFVDPERGGERIGSSILDRFERRLRAEGFEEARLRSVRNAVGFYESRGYEPIERVTNTTTAGVEVDSIRMEKSL